MKLYLDPGHGGTDPGAQGNGLKEKDINLDIAKLIRNILEQGYENIDVRMSRTSDITKSLSQRTDEANSWGADFYLSIHCNAFNGQARGYEDYIHSSLSDTSLTGKYQDIIHTEVTKLNNLINRGQKKANFHVLRETAMPALLSENGFIDNPDDAAFMKDPLWRQKVAQGHVNGIAKAFKLKPKEVMPSAIYKVISGSFKSKENADERVIFLKAKGIESIVVTASIAGAVWFRVQAGAFNEKENAEKRLAEVKSAGIIGAFILKENTASLPVESKDYPIVGKTLLSPEQMNKYAKKVNPNAINLGFYYTSFGEHYGIRGDIAFAQAMLETNFLLFTGDVKAGQNNFAGIGATGDGASGASFNSPKDGVLSHIQHLFAYASSKPLPPGYPLVDPRFHLVERGVAPAWTELNGRWAVPGKNYGESILNIYKSMLSDSIQDLGDVLKEIDR
ncbi:N-acetylmuramoyl-L-alanine amidase [Cytobacillus oceanisediminis]|uniref:N-acetylmuramoyl-L-alanine amidase n=2 Tax=Cytobacillus oceanisediminis TaxID=665099 RepID=A0A2V3A4S7_9BACI|nr:N-acetylmuramoyl-L-alanine amidase [Cytobacillus oceanisediminis]